MSMWRRAVLPVMLVSCLVAASGTRAAGPVEQPVMLRLLGTTFDPLAQPQSAASANDAQQAAISGQWIIQFTGPVQEEWKSAVLSAGAKLYGYLPDFAFIARADPAAVGQVRALPFVRWVGPYQTAFRLAPELMQSTGAQASSSDTAPITLTVQLLPDISSQRLGALREFVAAVGGAILAESGSQYSYDLRVRIPAGQSANVAAQNEVTWVEPYIAMRRLNDSGGGGIMRVNRGT